MKRVLFLFCFFSMFLQVSAQTATVNPKMDEIITALEKTQFMETYRTYKDSTESKILEINLKKNLSEQEVGKVKIAYRQSQSKFNAIINQLKRDLGNSSTRKMLRKSPDIFIKSYEIQLEAAKKYCNNTFHIKADLILKKDGIDQVQLAEILMKTFFELFKSFSEYQLSQEIFNMTYLETKLIQPLQFKDWDNIK